jgi:hypothetical protein
MYGEHIVDVSTVRSWARHFKRGETEIGRKLRNGRPAPALRADKNHTEALVEQDFERAAAKSSVQPVPTKT